jgi:hypothetical protein
MIKGQSVNEEGANETTITIMRDLAVWRSQQRLNMILTDRRMVFLDTINTDPVIPGDPGILTYAINYAWTNKKIKKKEEQENQRKELTLDELLNVSGNFQIVFGDISTVMLRTKRLGLIDNMKIEYQKGAIEFLLRGEQSKQLKSLLPSIEGLKSKVINK